VVLVDAEKRDNGGDREHHKRCLSDHAYLFSTSWNLCARDVDVRLERLHQREGWICTLSTNGDGGAVRGMGHTAREAIRRALEQTGVEIP
jgi:hypothetical protein